MPLLQPYLELGGTEVANALRTLTYLARGLGGAEFAVAMDSSPSVGVGTGYDDHYSETYAADEYWPGFLACYCEQLDTSPYVSPAEDPAPWYDADRPESADFFGIVPEVTLAPVIARSVAPRSGRGATVGAHRPSHRIVQVTGTMYASSVAGMAYGERWLTLALAGELEGCADHDLRILPACPPDDAEEPESYWRNLGNVGIVDGPIFSDQAGAPSCHLQSVAFQLAAGAPHLASDTEECLALSFLRADPTLCCLLEPEAPLASAAARITVHAGAVGLTVTGIEITAAPTSAGACPSAEDDTVSFTVDYLPIGRQLVVDAAKRTVTVTDANGDPAGGFDALSFEGLWRWVEARRGEQVCVCVDATSARLNAGTLVTIERQDLEL